MAKIISFHNTLDKDQLIPMILVNHIPRSGGTTLEGILKQSHEHLFLLKYPIDWQETLIRLKGVNEASAISGHYTYGIHEHIDNRFKVFYLTMLRNPIDLCISIYKASFQHSCIHEPFKNYINNTSTPNLMVSYLGNGDLGLAKDRLEKFYYLFGIVEYYKETLELFSKYLPISQQTEIIKENITKNSDLSLNILLDRKAKEIILERNDSDVRLYEWGLSIFKKRLSDKNIVIEEKKRKYNNLPDIKISKHITHDHSIYKAIVEDNIHEAIKLLEMDKTDEFSKQKRLVNLYRKINNREKTENSLLRLDHFWKDGYKLELAHFYLKSNPERSSIILNYLIDEYGHLITNKTESFVNRFIATCYSDLGKLLLAKGQFKLALKMVRRSYLLDSKNVSFYKQYIKALFDQKDYETVLNVMEQWVMPEERIFKQIISHCYEFGFVNRVMSLLSKENVCDLSYRKIKSVAFEKILKSGQNVLLIRTAPFVLLDYITQLLNKFQLSLSVLTSISTISKINKNINTKILFFFKG